MSISDKWEDGQMSGTFDGFRKQALVRRADSTDSPGQNLSSFGDEVTQELSIFEIDIGDFLSAKLAYSFTPNTKPSWTWHSSSPFYLLKSGEQALIPDIHSLQT
jgi:hypothetical protein